MNPVSFFKNGGLKSTMQNLGMKLNSARPEILFVIGGLSVLGGTIYACTKTEEAKETAKEAKSAFEKVELEYNIKPNSNIDISPEARRKIKAEKGKELVKVSAVYLWKFIKIYGLPAFLWLGGMGIIGESIGELRKSNARLIADSIVGKRLFDEYRERVAEAVGKETENKIYMGAQEGMVKVLEKDPESGKEVIVEKKADIFVAQPGSIFARNFTNETSDAFDERSYAEYYLESRINSINQDLELGIRRAVTGLDVLRRLGYNENSLTERLDDDDMMEKLLRYGISGNPRKVPDPEMRKLKVTRLRGFVARIDPVTEETVYVPCLRLDFNFYPLEGKI